MSLVVRLFPTDQPEWIPAFAGMTMIDDAKAERAFDQRATRPGGFVTPGFAAGATVFAFAAA